MLGIQIKDDKFRITKGIHCNQSTKRVQIQHGLILNFFQTYIKGNFTPSAKYNETLLLLYSCKVFNPRPKVDFELLK